MPIIVRHLRIVCLLGLELLILGFCSFSLPILLGADAPMVPETASASGSHLDSSARARVPDGYGKLPLSFEANQGQTDERVKFLTRGGGYTLFLTGNEAVFVLRKAADLTENRGNNRPDIVGQRTSRRSARYLASVLRLGLVDANPAAQVIGLNELPGKSNYFIGNDPKKWHTGVPNYAKVRYQNVYPGVDLVYYGNQRQLEYDFVVAPSVDPSVIRLNVEAPHPSKQAHQAAALRIDANGDLFARVNGNAIRFHKPVVYQLVRDSGVPSAHKRFIDGQYRIDHGNKVSFDIGRYDRTKSLIIDPVLVYSSLLGGGSADVGRSIALDSSGNVYLTGYTNSTDFPQVNQIAGAGPGGNNDAFVTKINATGTELVYSSYLGGSGDDLGYGIAVDSTGNAYVTGATASGDFPRLNQIAGACQGACGSGTYRDAFVTKLNSDGNALVYSSLVGGSGLDWAWGIAVDGAGSAYLIGQTQANTQPSDFPQVNQISGACQGSCGTLNHGNVFVTKIAAAGDALAYSSLIGGSSAEQGYAIAVDSSGNAYLTGQTDSRDFPILNQISGACQGNCVFPTSAFVTKIDSAGDALVYSSFLGGSINESGGGIAVDNSGNAYLTGYTSSPDFPRVNQIPGACQGQCGNGTNTDAFVTKINAAGSSLVYSSLIGGSADENVSSSGGAGWGAIAVDNSGNAYLTGYTVSNDFPQVDQIPGACEGSCGSGYPNYYDAFVIKVSAAGDALVYSSYLGGSLNEYGRGIAVDSSGSAYLTGHTESSDFPRVNQIPGACRGGCGRGGLYNYDAYVTKVASGPTVNLSPAFLDFGPQGVSGPNTPQVVTLTNTGGANLLITDIAITGQNSSDFDQTNDCPLSPNPLTPNGFCKITVYFFPDETGMLNAAVTITDNAPDSPQMVSLAGIGIGGKVRPK